MKEKTIKTLEFDKILNMLESKTETSLGKEYLHNSQISTNIEDIKISQQETSEGVFKILSKGTPPFGGVHRIKESIKRAELGGVLSASMLLKIAGNLRASRLMLNYINSHDSNEDIKDEILSKLVNKLHKNNLIEETIFNAIISEEEISDNASTKLRSIRRDISNKNSMIKNKLNALVSSTTFQKYLQEAIITIRNDRYVVPVKQEFRHQVKGLIHDQSSTGATLFIEPLQIVELNNELNTLYIDERKEIERILAELSDLVAAISEDLRENEKILSKLDFIFAKSKFSIGNKCIEPLLNTKGYINIKNGRHPLIPKEEVVPTDIWIGNEFNTLIITGPNTGGKTVCLKTLGLFTLMTQFGLHIPASSGSEMGVFYNVFADIGDEQSIEQSLSTFSSHMKNIVEIFNEVQENSLILLDEVGAGTDPVEGAALATSILDKLNNLNVITAATTHYSELKIYALTQKGVINASVEFDVETLSPTYKVLIGVPGKSNAFEISKKLGLNDEIIDEARSLIEKNNIEFEDALLQISNDRKETEEAKEIILNLKKEQEKLNEKIKLQEEKMKLQKDKYLRDAKQEARKILEKAKFESSEIISKLEKYSSDLDKKIRKDINDSRENLNNSLSEYSSNEYILKTHDEVENIKKGDYVFIQSLDQSGYVITDPIDEGNVTVQVGVIKLNLPINTLKKSEAKEEIKSKSDKKKMMKLKIDNIKSTVDLRGMNLEDAFLEIDKYLDDAYLAGLNEVQIIHGKGTGVLRKGITELLKKHRLVEEFRIGNYGEGGTGITIVKLK